MGGESVITLPSWPHLIILLLTYDPSLMIKKAFHLPIRHCFCLLLLIDFGSVKAAQGIKGCNTFDLGEIRSLIIPLFSLMKFMPNIDFINVLYV